MATTKPQGSASHAAETATEKKPVPKKIDPHQFITVKNGFQGRLIYVSKRTGEKFVWESFGDEQEIELIELKNAKNASKKFFINNWFVFEDSWVIDYLGVGQFYKNALRLEDFDRVFTLSPNEIRETIGKLSAGQKRSLAYRAKELIAKGEIDSNRAIAALEESLGIELVER